MQTFTLCPYYVVRAPPARRRHRRAKVVRELCMRTDVKEAQPACRKHKMIKRMLCRKVYPYLYGAMLYCVAARVACPPSPAPTYHPRRTTLNQNAKRNIPVAADAKDTACPATRLRRLACMPRASQRGSELWLQSDCIKRRAINNNIGTTRTIKPTTQHASLSTPTEHATPHKKSHAATCNKRRGTTQHRRTARTAYTRQTWQVTIVPLKHRRRWSPIRTSTIATSQRNKTHQQPMAPTDANNAHTHAQTLALTYRAPRYALNRTQHIARHAHRAHQLTAKTQEHLPSGARRRHEQARYVASHTAHQTTHHTLQPNIDIQPTSATQRRIHIHHHAPLGLSTMARTHHGHEAHQCLPNAKRHESLMCSMRQATQTIVDLLRAMGGTPQCGGAPAQQIMLPATRRAK